jgi:hypothetical protein
MNLEVLLAENPLVEAKEISASQEINGAYLVTRLHRRADSCVAAPVVLFIPKIKGKRCASPDRSKNENKVREQRRPKQLR